MANKLWKIKAKKNVILTKSTGFFSSEKYEILKGMEVEVITQWHCRPTPAQIAEAFNNKYGFGFGANNINTFDFDITEA